MTNRAEKSLNTIWLGELSLFNETRIPYTQEVCDSVVKMMKKYRTDVLKHDHDYFTIMGNDIVRIEHKKIHAYEQFLKSKEYDTTVDSEYSESWDEYINN
jgi:predicted AlkP superfamily phosphohydrolase/phosphomutase